jgi:uncharacterized membrane protein required for colicin V production
MTLLDWAIVVVSLGVALSGFWKGAVRVVFGVGGAAAGVWLAVVAGAELAATLLAALEPDWAAEVVAWLGLFVCCAGLGVVAGWGLERTLEAMGLRFLDRVLGALVVGGAGVFVVALLVVVAAQVSPAFADLCQRSLLPPYLLDLVGGVGA